MEDFAIRKVYVSVALTEQKTYWRQDPQEASAHRPETRCLLTSERATLVLEPIQLVRPAGMFALLNLLVSERVKAYY